MSPSTDVRGTSSSTRKVAAACGVVVLLLAASACGSKGGDKQNPSAQGQYGGPRTDQAGQGGPPGANGKVAAVDGSTAQVQGMDGQIAVSWSGSTTFTKEVSGTLSDVTVGSCVLVASSGDGSSGSTPATTVAATNVRIMPKTDGSCGGQLRGPGPQSGTNGGPQLNGNPPPGPEGGQRPQVRSFGGAVGEVTAVSASGFTVDSMTPGSTDKTAVTVTVEASTTYTTTAAGAASDVKVGVCVTAAGSTDQTGAVTATTVAIAQPVDGQCGGMMRLRSDDGPATSQES